MPVDRPTFSESWYRVAELRPRLRSTVQVHRQHYRGQMWHVLQDPSSNQFFRLNEAAYHFVALLDGRRSVAEVWTLCNEQLGDNAPTQGEAIQLMGQLYGSNLIQAELAPDSQGLFTRYRNRVSREVRGYLSNLLFIRIPLYDPDHFLNRWLSVFGWVFGPVGAVLLTLMICTGLYFVIGNWGELSNTTMEMFANQLLAQNVVALYGTFVLVKVLHEFGHAFACKRFGVRSGTGGEVHQMGIMFMVFMPMPYVDASSSWALRSKFHRITVGAAGMLVELGLASVAAVVWANTSPSSPVHALAYNVMLLASVSTLLFNANPLLRYDGYYMLSDLLEIPNLAQRSKQYLHYLVKRYVWGVRLARNPAHTRGERGWFVFYGIASTIYRTIVVVGILLFVSSQLAILGAMLALAAAFAWVAVPLGKFVHYLATSNELSRKRPRAVATVLVFVAALTGSIGAIPAPDRVRVEGVVEPVRLALVHAKADGFVQNVLPWGPDVKVSANGEPLLLADNPQLREHIKQLLAQRQQLQIQKDYSLANGDIGTVQATVQALAARDREIDRMTRELADLELRSPIDGLWIAPHVESMVGAFIRRGDQVAMVASPDELLIRAVAPNDDGVQLIEQAKRSGSIYAEIRVKGQPSLLVRGSVQLADIVPAGQERLPSLALSAGAGGPIATDPEDREGTKTAEHVFELRVRPQMEQGMRLLSGQRVVVRFDTEPKPLGTQWLRSLKRLLLRKFNI